MIITLLDALTLWLPKVSLDPKDQLFSGLILGMGYFNSFMALYPPLQIIFNAFIYLLLFELTLLILRVFHIITLE
jgi:hypothetical protein